LPAGDYQIFYRRVAGFDFITTGTPLTPEGSYAGTNGRSPQFNLPGDSNTTADAACTLENANVVIERKPVALPPTVAVNDTINGTVGETLTSMITRNDRPCLAQVLAVDIIGHNVPGDVSYNAANGVLTIANTTESGTFSIEYGLRGGCGSYSTAVVSVTLAAVVPPQPPEAPEAPRRCFASIGKGTGLEAGAHIDLTLIAGETHAIFAPQYNFYDADENLVYTGVTSQTGTLPNEGIRPSWGIYWRKREHGLEVLDIKFAAAVENGVESNLVACARRTVTPIALDVDESGAVERINGDFAFDMNGDGVDEVLMQWFAPTDGILIRKGFEGEMLTVTVRLRVMSLKTLLFGPIATAIQWLMKVKSLRFLLTQSKR